MSECICSSCKNLKSVVNNESEELESKCEFGFPSDKCETCDSEECAEECVHYEEDTGEVVTRTVNCKQCGRELQKAFEGDDDDGDVFCVTCYMKNNGMM